MDASDALSLLLPATAAVVLVGGGLVYRSRPRVRTVNIPVATEVSRELNATRCYKAAAVPDGSAQVVGTASNPSRVLRTPIWGHECVAYRADLFANRTVSHRSAGSLTAGNLTTLLPVHEEADAVAFDVVDETGRVRVEADSRSRLVVYQGRSSSRGLLSKLTPEAQAYLERTMNMLEGSVQVTECWIPVGAKCYVAGHGIPATAAGPARLVHGDRRLIISV